MTQEQFKHVNDVSLCTNLVAVVGLGLLVVIGPYAIPLLIIGLLGNAYCLWRVK